MTNTKTPSEGFLRKASVLKPLKRIDHILDTSAACKLKDNSTTKQKRVSNSHKEGQNFSKSSTSKPSTPTGGKDSHERRGSGDGSSHVHHGNMSPGDPAGVKDVANVVVKYLSPHLKQGSIVSKVIMYVTLIS